MRRLVTPLATAYCIAALALLCQAVYAHRRGDTGAIITLGTCAILFGLAVSHHAYHRDELRFARAQLDANARPTDHTPAIDGVVKVALAAACCERWWTSAGAEHDPEHCTRKDQTT